ncbi:MAG: NAD kinase [Petrimonas sp.]|jgi:NAD+ kinase|nr:MAG: putative inorganic polyphosphate/ATP-NAD kinase [Bacteroidetes bacterium ADurb.BinA174]
MKIALFGSVFSEQTHRAESQIIEVCEAVKEHPVELYLPDTLFYSLSSATQDKIRPLCLLFDVPPPVDLALSVGGDGTFLRTAAAVGNSGIPVLGINTGRLGFLADVNFIDLRETLNEIFADKYDIEERSLLEVRADEEFPLFSQHDRALNEVAILKQDTASMLTIHTYINNDFLTSYQADGLIVATPTGSTAYSLSVGGPILVPNSPNFILSPIAPHNLTSRPLVVQDNVKIKLRIESRSNSFLVSLDGHSQVCHVRTEIEVQKTDYTLKVVKRKGHTFYETLRDKLMWGVDVRQK